MEWWEDLDDLWKALIISIGIVIILFIIAGIIDYNVQLNKLSDNTGKVIDKKYEILITKEGAEKWIEVTKEEFEKYKIGDIYTYIFKESE